MAADVLSALAMSAEAERTSDIIGQKECLKSWHIQQLVDETVIVQESQEPS
jgi:hypothetical protein